MFKILIAGDFVIDKKYSLSNISEQVVDLFKSSDYNIVNLEAPITDSKDKILKTGPHLKAEKSSTLHIIKALNVNLVTLANNHILDYQEKGVLDTLYFCRENDITTVGAGRNLAEASETYYKETKEGKIAFVNLAENEWASATENRAGANPMDIIDNAKQIKKAKLNADFVFVIVHGGHEYYNLPSPRMQKQYRYYAECGADLVVGHHTHCISGSEIYNDVPIYYSLGNFLFTKHNTHDDWYTGLILEIEIRNKKILTKTHVVKQEKNTFKLGIAQENYVTLFRDRINNYSKIINDSHLLLLEWQKYIYLRYDAYLNFWSPLSLVRNRYVKAAFQKLGIKIINKSGLSYYLNLMRCEAHYDVSKEVMEKYLSKK